MNQEKRIDITCDGTVDNFISPITFTDGNRLLARFLNFDHCLLCESRRYRNWTFSVLGCRVGVAISQRGPTEGTVFSHLSPEDKNRLGFGHFTLLSRKIFITSIMHLLQHTVEMNVVGWCLSLALFTDLPYPVITFCRVIFFILYSEQNRYLNKRG